MGKHTVVDWSEKFDNADDEEIGKYFSFLPGIPATIRSKDGKIYVTRFYICDTEMMMPGIFLRTDDYPERLLFIPWSNINSIESIVLADSEGESK
jgi:hypothetical protein